MSNTINRRGFLKLFGGAAAAAAVPTYFLPPIGGWKSDVLAHPSSYRTYLVGKEALIAEEIAEFDSVFAKQLACRASLSFDFVLAQALASHHVQRELREKGLEIDYKAVVELLMPGLPIKCT